MSDKRMVQGFEIIQSVEIGPAQIVVGYNPKQPEGLHFMTAFCERNMIYEIYRDAKLSSNYAEVIEIFGQRVAEKAAEVLEQLRAEDKDAGINSPVTANLCRDGSGWNPVKPTDNLNGKVLVIRPEVLKYEYRRMTHQLVYCNGGFGAEPCARGSAVYCTNIYSGQKSRYERGDILAIVDPAALEEEAEWSPWIKEGLKKIEEKSHKDKGGEAR